MKQLFYASRARGPLSTVDLERILFVSRRNNAQRDLTGLLVYLNGGFMQVLEGPDKALEFTLRQISADERHEMLAIWTGAIDARAFPEWRMGYACLGADDGPTAGFAEVFNDEMTLASLPGLDPLLRRFLKAFRACFHPADTGLGQASSLSGSGGPCARRAPGDVIPIRSPA